MKLLPTIGIENLLFGMTEQEVALQLGGRLGYIHCASHNLQVNGKQIIGQPVDVVKEQFQQTSPKDWEVEAYTFFDTHFSESLWLILNVEYGVVTDVEIGVPFKNDEEYDWKR